MYSPPLSEGRLVLHWRFDATHLHAQLRATEHTGRWLAVGFPIISGQMTGSTAVIGSDDDGVQVYALSGKYRELVGPLATVWQTLTGDSFEVVDGVTVLTFSKKLDEDLPEQPSDQQPITPDDEKTDLLIAAGGDAELNYHGQYRYAASLWLGWAHSTPPPFLPPSPPPTPPSIPPSPLPPLPLPPGPPPSPPPSQCVGGATVSSLDPAFACEIRPPFPRPPGILKADGTRGIGGWNLATNTIWGFKLHWRTDATHVHFRLERTMIGGPIQWGSLPEWKQSCGPFCTTQMSWYDADQMHDQMDVSM